MPKTAVDPYFGSNQDATTPARHAAPVTPSDTADLGQVTKLLIVTTGAGATGIAVLFPEDLDSAPVTIPLSASQTYLLPLQVRRVMNTSTALGTGGTVIACWGG